MSTATEKLAPRIAIRAKHMFDGYRFHAGPVLITIDDGRIGAVDFCAGLCPPETTLIDLGDWTLLPGLVDAHAHLCWDPHGKPEDLASEPQQAQVNRARRQAEAALRSGITTIRDLGDCNFATVSLREEYRQGATLGPELLISGPPLTPKGGHCWFLGGEADSTEELIKAVEERAARGVDWIKVMATGGFVTAGTDPWRPQYSHDQLATIVATANRVQLPVTAHAHATTGIAAVIDAGIRSVEHATFLNESGVAADERVVHAIVAAGVWCGITVGYLPSSLPKEILALAQNLRATVRQLMDSGANIAFSSDAGINANKPLDVLPVELVELSRHGFTSTEVLTCATAAAATSVGLGHRKGRIAPGYDADLIAVANLNHDLTGLCDIKAVWRGGTEVLRQISAGNPHVQRDPL
ncbi:MAG: amidohydrolase family protein [Mycobacteriaceae bacterium]|nr:amidohydrolase family protein [Mycobacteriaceae bacterium]